VLPHFTASRDGAVPITPVTKDGLPAWLETAPAATQAWVRAVGFTGEAGKTALLPGEGGGLQRVLVGVKEEDALWRYAGLPDALPEGSYAIDAEMDEAAARQAALGWALGTYAFTRYKKRKRGFATLVWPGRAPQAEIARLARAVFLARDLVNTPAEEMGPAELAAAAAELAKGAGAQCEIIVGDELLARNYPMIHAVGRGSARAPRLVDIAWGDPSHPKVTLVGKGVCFDSGGLDLKPSSGMKIMKKDMGGAATVLGLASAIIDARLPVRLRVLVPAVENFVSATSFRPLDIIRTRSGKTVEIGNTDAEGRLILGDALVEAVTEKPALLLDCATLTGAARVALGPELPALFCNDDAVADGLLAAAREEADPMWRLPLWQPYRKMLDSKVADLNNVSDSSFAGSITAALYLQEFVGAGTPWVHFDLYAWNPSAKPGRPEGGEAQTLRAVYAYLRRRFA
jgi:leucyl aminopeptidase